MPDEYSKESVVKVPWPRWDAIPAGFSRTWLFVFKEAVDPQACLQTIPGADGVEHHPVIGNDPFTLVVTSVAPADFEPNSDKHYFDDAVRLFKSVEAQFGTLRTIHGVARDSWRGFR